MGLPSTHYLNHSLSTPSPSWDGSPSRACSTSPKLQRSSPLRNESFSSVDFESDSDQPVFSLKLRRDSSSEIEDCLDDANGKQSHDPNYALVLSVEPASATGTKAFERDSQVDRDRRGASGRLEVEVADIDSSGQHHAQHSGEKYSDLGIHTSTTFKLDTKRQDIHLNQSSFFAPKPKPQFPRSAPLRPLTSTHSRSLLPTPLGGRQHVSPIGLDGSKGRCQPHRQKMIVPKKSLRMSFDLGLTQSELARVA